MLDMKIPWGTGTRSNLNTAPCTRVLRAADEGNLMTQQEVAAEEGFPGEVIQTLWNDVTQLILHKIQRLIMQGYPTYPWVDTAHTSAVTQSNE